MRGIRAAGVSIALALSATDSTAQTEAQPRPAAARFGVIRKVEKESAVAPARLVIRSQAPGDSLPGSPLGVPQPLNPPSVTEIRGGSSGAPIAQTPNILPYGAPFPAQPYPAQPIVGYPPPSPSVIYDGPVEMAPHGFAGPTLDAPLYGGAIGAPSRLLAGPGKFQVGAEYLLWFAKSFNVPVLVTTGSAQSNGILGRPDTRVLAGGMNVGNERHSGGRFTGLYWFGDRQRFGVDGDVWFLGESGGTSVFNSANNPLLARPFFNVNQGINFSELVAAPGVATGTVAVANDRSLWGAQINLRHFLACAPCARADIFAGFRYMNLNESLQITESFSRLPGSMTNLGVTDALAGTITDRFRTENDFYGGQVGLTGNLQRGRWNIEARGSIALGGVRQSVEVDGGQQIQFIDRSNQFVGGLLGLPGANIGRFQQNKVGVIPEVTLRLKYAVTNNFQLSIGYNFLYLNTVLRPGDQIDTGLDVNRIPNFPLPGPIPNFGVARPAVVFRDTDIFVQGITFGLHYTW